MDIWKPSEPLAKFSASRPKFSLADLKPEIPSLATGHLDYALFVFIANQMTKVKDCSEHISQYALAHQILRFMLGDSWVEQHIFDHEEVVRAYRPGRAFLKSDSPESSERLRHQHRVISLAECLYNMQRVPGIDYRIASIKTDSLQSAYGELQCARIIAAPTLRLRFINPTGQSRSDYDAEFSTATGRTICCEFKAKAEDSEFSAKTIVNAIETARKQLPDDKPGFVFIILPEHCAAQTDAKVMVNSVIKRAFIRTGRIAAVVIAWESWAMDSKGGWVESRFDTSLNLRCRYYATDLEDSLKWFGSHASQDWLQLPAYVASRITNMKEFIRERMASEA